MIYTPCICGHSSLDHLYPHNYPWWKFWKQGTQLGPCYNKECEERVVFNLNGWETERCVWFKLDNLKYLEQLYEVKHK